jgi:anti-sigma-K factor RskA
MNDELKIRGAEYLLGQLDADAQAAFEKALRSGDADTLRAVAEAREMLGLVGLSAEPVAPPASARSRLMNSIATVRDPQHMRILQLTRANRWLAAAALLAVALSLTQLVYIARLSDTIGDQQTTIGVLRTQMARIEIELARKESMLQMVAAPQTRVIALNPTPANPQGSGRMIWETNRRTGIFFANGLPKAPSDREWELWAIQDGKPISLGVFETNESGQSVMDISVLPDSAILTFAVTLEPKGGKPEPEGDIYIVGS